MFSTSKLTADQQDALRQAAAGGATLADLQRLLKESYGHSVTYMDMRFVVLDLGIELIGETKTAEPDAAAAPAPGDTAGAAPGTVTVSMDSITLPGMLVSGKVTFSDGETGVWMIDQTGRPGLDPDTPGYRPSQQDIMEFQDQLQAMLQSGRL